MKKIIILTLAASLVWACFPDERLSNMVDDSFGFSSVVAVQDISVHPGTFTVGIAKSGIGRSAASVTVEISPDDCAEAIGTAYKVLPAKLVTLSENTLSFGEKDVTKSLVLNWDPEQVISVIGEDKDYVIPLHLSSSGLTVNKGRDVLLLRLNRSGIEVSQKTKAFSVEKKKVEKEGAVLKEKISLDLTISTAISRMDLEFPVEIDNSLVEEFNKAEEGRNYIAAEPGLVTILDESVTIKEGTTGCTVKLQLDKGKLMKDGKLEEFPDYVIPVRVCSDKLKARLYGKEIDPEGIDYGNMVTYVTVTYYVPPTGVHVSRLWGLYSSAEGSWSRDINGFNKGTDRNVAMDDENIYIAEFGSSKNLWAINLDSPSQTFKLNTENVKSEGYGAANIYLTCPRVIPNTDPEVNGGKDVLAVSNLQNGEVMNMYFYTSGITAKPSLVEFKTPGAGRRLGDTWSFWGTLQEGMFYFKDTDDGTALMTFKQTGKTSGSNTVQGRFVLPAHDSNIAACYWPYPEDKNKGIYGLRSPLNSYLVSLSSDSWEASGGNETTSVKLSDDYVNCAFRMFSLKSRRYIAYIEQKSNSDGRFYVLMGDAADDWADILQERNVIYYAALQNDSEMEDDPKPSPLGSANSGIDLDVRNIDDEIYIAALKQNVGLSLFRLTDY